MSGPLPDMHRCVCRCRMQQMALRGRPNCLPSWDDPFCTVKGPTRRHLRSGMGDLLGRAASGKHRYHCFAWRPGRRRTLDAIGVESACQRWHLSHRKRWSLGNRWPPARLPAPEPSAMCPRLRRQHTHASARATRRRLATGETRRPPARAGQTPGHAQLRKEARHRAAYDHHRVDGERPDALAEADALSSSSTRRNRPVVHRRAHPPRERRPSIAPMPSYPTANPDAQSHEKTCVLDRRGVATRDRRSGRPHGSAELHE